MLALIPVIAYAISERFYYDRKTLFSVLFLIGETGTVYSLIQYWLTTSQTGFWEYFKFIFSGLLFFIPYWNFKAESPNILEGKSAYDYVVNGSLCGLFILGFLSALYKTMSNVSLYGISEYFALFVLFGLFFIIIITYLVITQLNIYDRKSVRYNVICLIPALIMMGFAVYYLNKAISLIPSWVFTAIEIGVLLFFLLIFGTLFSSQENY
jgi:hypothetical protein